MATIQLSTTKVANRLLSYAEKRAMERSGVDCPAEYAKSQFKATRELWGKTEGIQAHHVIQSFKPGEVTPELANQMGQDLAREIAKGYEAVVYTHTDKEHIHNHIVINSVSFEDGKKYQAHGKQAIEKVREVSDRLCLERGLSIVQEPAKERYHRAEYGLAKRGEMSWKDEIREAVKLARDNSSSLQEMKTYLQDKFEIEMKIQNKNVSFKHPEQQRFVRGTKLGHDYEKGVLEDGFGRQIESSKKRGVTELPSSTRERERDSHSTSQRVAEEFGGQSKTYGHSEGLRQRSDGQTNRSESNDRTRVSADKGNERNRSTGNDFDIEKARAALAGEQRSLAEGFGKWQERNDAKQRSNDSAASRDPKQPEQANERDKNRHADRDQKHEKQRARQRKRVRTQDFELGR
ncbi:relaxase/mobilization nuclease domain-containing protein [Ectobacillus funiculus]|uniref:relaxase/mobilization nuclease domain-containing protein n=1 Tax=Ectobacillus funiculus TaxID=137993 RepID=UPI00101C2851|nr:relaxase/mobilization nuclease domain-containing protein [Ectobacillus funiculus]